MAHTLGNSSTRANSASTTITTATFTPDSGVTCLVLKLWVLSATSRAGGAPTYNGVTMSQAGSTQKAAASPEVSVEIWYLTGASAAVAATASIPNSGALTIHYTFCTGKAGSGKTSAYDNAVGSNNTSTNPSCGAFTMAANSIGFALAGTGLQTPGTFTPSHTALEAVFDAGATGGASQYHINNAGGSVTFSWTANSDDWGATAVSFKEINAYSLSCDPGSYTTTGSDATLTYTGASLAVRVMDGSTVIREEVYTPGTLATSTIELTTDERGDITSWPPFVRLIKANAQIDVAEVWFTAPESAGARTLSCDAGSHAVTGSDAALTVGRVLSTDAGSHAVTGSDATLTYARAIVTDAGSHAVTGADATLAQPARALETAAGSYVVTGSDATLQFGKVLSADAGSYAVTGADASTLAHRVVSAEVGSHDVTGADATLQRSGLSLSVDAGSYAVTGSDPSFLRAYVLTSEAGVYALTGADATLHEQATLTVRIMDGATLIREEVLTPDTLATTPIELLTAERNAITSWPPFVRLIKVNEQIDVAEVWWTAPTSDGLYSLSCDAGSYAVTGSDATLQRTGTYSLTCDAGSYAVTGSNATLTYSGGGITGTGDLIAPGATGDGTGTVGSTAYSLTCDAGSYATTGSNATLNVGRVVSTEAGSYAVTGSDATLQRTGVYSLTTDVGSYAVTGSDASFLVTHVLITDAGVYALTGADATLQVARVLSGEAGSYATAGSDATFSRGYVLTVDAGDYALTGALADLLRTGAYQVSGEPGVYAITGADALLQVARLLTADAGAYSLTGVDATMALGRAVAAEAGAYAVTGSDATLNKIGALSFTGEPGAYDVTGSAATLQRHYVLMADAGAYALTGADISVLRSLILQAGAGAYVITGTDATLDGYVLHGVNPRRTLRVPAKPALRVPPNRSVLS
jgi:hypothetical protein